MVSGDAAARRRWHAMREMTRRRDAQRKGGAQTVTQQPRSVLFRHARANPCARGNRVEKNSPFTHAMVLASITQRFRFPRVHRVTRAPLRSLSLLPRVRPHEATPKRGRLNQFVAPPFLLPED